MAPALLTLYANVPTLPGGSKVVNAATEEACPDCENAEAQRAE
jgi:hypothetical protein